MKHLTSIMLILACLGLLPAQADCATSRASMLVSATTVALGIYTNIKFIDAHGVETDSDDPAGHFPATAAGGDQPRDDAFKRQLREQLSQLEILKGVPYIISLEGGSSETILRLLIQTDDVLVFEDITDSFEIENEKVTVVISLRY